MIRHTSAVACDKCGATSVPADTAKEARVYAERGGFIRRTWNRRLKDLCGPCAADTPPIETPKEKP